MNREIGPRERALREMREAKYGPKTKAAGAMKQLEKAVTVASQKRGKPRKPKK